MTNSTTLSPESVPSFRKRAERAAGHLALRIVPGAIRILPLPVAQILGRVAGTFSYRILGRYRRVALKNLALIYGAEISAAERMRMAVAVFQHFGQVAFEFFSTPRLNSQEFKRFCIADGEENLRAGVESGRGVLIVTGHIGNWELLCRWMTLHGYPFNAVTRDARDPLATKLLTDTRQGNGAQVLYRGNSARAVLQSLRKKELVGLLPDQNAADVFVPFLGQRTGTVDGPAIIHLKTGAPIVFAWCVRMADGRYHLQFEPPLVVEPTGDRNADIALVMTKINAALEEQIRKAPTQWLWLHDRWKASPGVFPDGEENARILKTPINKSRQEN